MTAKILDTKKELILQTASKLLARNGFAKTTLEDIANALGMKKSSLYYYYSNKDALLDDVMKQEGETFCSIARSSLERSTLTIDKILNYEKAKFNYIRETIKLHEISTSIFLELKSKMFKHIQDLYIKETDMLKKTLDEGVKKKEIKKCDTKKVAELILTLSEALRHRELYFASFSVNKTIDFSKALNEINFAIKLIFDGLAVK